MAFYFRGQNSLAPWVSNEVKAIVVAHIIVNNVYFSVINPKQPENKRWSKLETPV